LLTSFLIPSPGRDQAELDGKNLATQAAGSLNAGAKLSEIAAMRFSENFRGIVRTFHGQIGDRHRTRRSVLMRQSEISQAATSHKMLISRKTEGGALPIRCW
jgi:hypothetical protein